MNTRWDSYNVRMQPNIGIHGEYQGYIRPTITQYGNQLGHCPENSLLGQLLVRVGVQDLAWLDSGGPRFHIDFEILVLHVLHEFFKSEGRGNHAHMFSEDFVPFTTQTNFGVPLFRRTTNRSTCLIHLTLR